MPLSPDVALDVRLSAICSRNRYVDDPRPVIAELRAAAGYRTDMLAKVAGSWVGYYEDEHTANLCIGLRTIDGAAAWVDEGRTRRGQPTDRIHPMNSPG